MGDVTKIMVFGKEIIIVFYEFGKIFRCGGSFTESFIYPYKVLSSNET